MSKTRTSGKRPNIGLLSLPVQAPTQDEQKNKQTPIKVENFLVSMSSLYPTLRSLRKVKNNDILLVHYFDDTINENLSEKSSTLQSWISDLCSKIHLSCTVKGNVIFIHDHQNPYQFYSAQYRYQHEENIKAYTKMLAKNYQLQFEVLINSIPYASVNETEAITQLFYSECGENLETHSISKEEIAFNHYLMGDSESLEESSSEEISSDSDAISIDTVKEEQGIAEYPFFSFDANQYDEDFSFEGNGVPEVFLNNVEMRDFQGGLHSSGFVFNMAGDSMSEESSNESSEEAKHESNEVPALYSFSSEFPPYYFSPAKSLGVSFSRKNSLGGDKENDVPVNSTLSPHSFATMPLDKFLVQGTPNSSKSKNQFHSGSQGGLFSPRGFFGSVQPLMPTRVRKLPFNF